MLLNRAVCLGSPEAKVPWFHEQYCQSILHTKQGKFFNCFENLTNPLIFVGNSMRLRAP